MEYSDAAAVELYRIRVLLTRFVLFFALFLLLIVGPVLGWLAWVGYAWTGLPGDYSPKSAAAQFMADPPPPDARALEFARNVPVMAEELRDSMNELTKKVFRPNK